MERGPLRDRGSDPGEGRGDLEVSGGREEGMDLLKKSFLLNISVYYFVSGKHLSQHSLA